MCPPRLVIGAVEVDSLISADPFPGIAHDSRVLKDVAYNPTSGFLIPPSDKYYLCDAAYTNTRGFMTPYRNTRYWLSDYRRRRASTKEERFNHAHAQLRNVIELFVDFEDFAE
ncbi:hypothetical protein L2E82_31020 [Cichorium intybus]|uniref:Uncharacterized protein n=1 Tax=Cichorium intybus TaxID=13427 RepID=A0ACB9D1V6_CICIN|nr:hypothetical protein L2E82_31020 [Cichorium intybus]